MSILKFSSLPHSGKRRQETAREQMVEFSRYQQSCDVNTSWLRSTDHHILKETIKREVSDALNQHEINLEDRRERLRRMLEEEEEQLLKEVDSKRESVSVDRVAKMKERAQTLRERREAERQQMVSLRLDQLFRDQCEELRTIQTKRREEQVCAERGAQLQAQRELRRHREEEEKVFARLWEADWQAKDKREREQLERQQHKNMEQVDVLRTQIQTAEQQRQQDKQLKDEEAQLMREQREIERLQGLHEQHQKSKAQEEWRGQLDRCLRLKMKRLAKEQQEELALDMSILQHLMKEQTDEKQEAAQKKAELREQQQKYKQYLAGALEQRKKEEDEIEHLMEAELEKSWAKRERESRMQREARSRLMKEVMETRSLQIQQKLDANREKQIVLMKESEELNDIAEKIKQSDAEEKSRHRRMCRALQTDLLAQMKHQQQLLGKERAEAVREHQQGLAMQEQHERRKMDVLSRPASNSAVVHNFRTAGHSRSATTRLRD